MNKKAISLRRCYNRKCPDFMEGVFENCKVALDTCFPACRCADFKEFNRYARADKPVPAVTGDGIISYC